jgi:hypothetical protein
VGVFSPVLAKRQKGTGFFVPYCLFAFFNAGLPFCVPDCPIDAFLPY